MYGSKKVSKQPYFTQQYPNKLSNNCNTKYMKIMHSFKTKHHSKQKMSIDHSAQILNIMSLEGSVIDMPKKKMSTPVSKRDLDNKKFIKSEKNSEFERKKLSRSSDIKNLSKDKKISFPSISFLKVNIPSNNHLVVSNTSPKTNQYRYKTEPSVPPMILIKSERKSNLPKICFNKVEGASNGNLLQFSRLKPTQQHFSKLENVRLAEKLLLMQPSKELRKSELKKFYNTQKTYRERISQSALIKKSNLYHLKMEKKHLRMKSEWIN